MAPLTANTDAEEGDEGAQHMPPLQPCGRRAIDVVGLMGHPRLGCSLLEAGGACGVVPGVGVADHERERRHGLGEPRRAAARGTVTNTRTSRRSSVVDADLSRPGSHADDARACAPGRPRDLERELIAARAAC